MGERESGNQRVIERFRLKQRVRKNKVAHEGMKERKRFKSGEKK